MRSAAPRVHRLRDVARADRRAAGRAEGADRGRARGARRRSSARGARTRSTPSLHAARARQRRVVPRLRRRDQPAQALDVLFDAFATLVARVVPAPRLVVVGELDDETYLSSAGDVREQDRRRSGCGSACSCPASSPTRCSPACTRARSPSSLPSLVGGLRATGGRGGGVGHGGRAQRPSGAPRVARRRGALRPGAAIARRLADALLQLVGDAQLRRRLEAEALAAVAGLTWDAAGRKLEQRRCGRRSVAEPFSVLHGHDLLSAAPLRRRRRLHRAARAGARAARARGDGRLLGGRVPRAGRKRRRRYAHPSPASRSIRSSGRLPRAAALAAYLTGRPAFYGHELAEVLSGGAFDVIHFHNVSLVGGPEVLRYGDGREGVHDARALARLPDARALP